MSKEKRAEHENDIIEKEVKYANKMGVIASVIACSMLALLITEMVSSIFGESLILGIDRDKHRDKDVNYQRDYEELNGLYIDEDKKGIYKEAMCFLLSPSVYSEELQNEFEGTEAYGMVSVEYWNKLRINKTENVSSEGDAEMAEEGSDEGEEDTIDYLEEYGGYPIYNIYGDILDYGTKEESEESYAEFMSAPQIVITGATYYREYITVYGNDKSYGEFSAIFILDKEGKIESYYILS